MRIGIISYRIFLITSQKKYDMDNMRICPCDLREQILLYDYKPIVQNENNVIRVKSCQKEFVPLP
jgi:hypothetical protein